VSDGKRYHPEYAGIIAEALLYHLGPRCERIEIAGSLRRKTADVGDIEIVCVPKEEFPQMSLAGIGSERGPKIVPLYDEIEGLSWLQPRFDEHGHAKMGKRYMALQDKPTGVPIDLFCVLPPAQWGVIMSIRTGPADFSHELMKIARRKGYKCEDGRLLDIRRKQGAPVSTPEEKDFFKMIGVAWTEPEERK
jgi:DNA polymerase/3'-5' exonuclease PolX